MTTARNKVCSPCSSECLAVLPIYLAAPGSHLTPAWAHRRDHHERLVTSHGRHVSHVSSDIRRHISDISSSGWLVSRVGDKWGLYICVSVHLTRAQISHRTWWPVPAIPATLQHSIQSADNCEFITSLNYLVSCQWQLYKIPRAAAVSSWSI